MVRAPQKLVGKRQMDRIMDIIYTKSEKKTKRFQVDW